MGSYHVGKQKIVCVCECVCVCSVSECVCIVSVVNEYCHTDSACMSVQVSVQVSERL